MNKNLFPEMAKMLDRGFKERLLGQKSKVIWFTGLSGAGKSTIGLGLEKKLYSEGILTQVLDGDVVRTGINKNLTFSEVDREENIRRISEVSKLLMNSGVVTINCFIAPTRKIRETAKDIIGRENFVEVYVSTPLDVCEQRDIKGLYKKARAGEIKNFTGISSPFEEPVHPDIEVDTSKTSLDEAVDEVFQKVIEFIKS